MLSSVIFVCVCAYLSVCFNSSETTGRTSTELGTTDHHAGHKGDCDVVMTSQSKLISFELHFLAEESGSLLKRNPVLRLSGSANFFTISHDVIIND